MRTICQKLKYQVWLDCKEILEIMDYNVINKRDYNSKSRNNQVMTWLNKFLKLD